MHCVSAVLLLVPNKTPSQCNRETRDLPISCRVMWCILLHQCPIAAFPHQETKKGKNSTRSQPMQNERFLLHELLAYGMCLMGYILASIAQICKWSAAFPSSLKFPDGSILGPDMLSLTMPVNTITNLTRELKLRLTRLNGNMETCQISA